MVNVTPRPLNPGKDPVPIVQGAGWAPRSVWTGAEYLASTRISIIEFLTSQVWLGNIHLSGDVVINRIRLGGLICSLKSFVQLNMCQELQIFAVVYMYSRAG